MLRSPYPASDVLIVLAKEPGDFYLAQTQQWYRIPTSTRLPLCFREGTVRFLAFYFPQAFKELRYSIRYYAAVTKVEVVTRADCFRVKPLAVARCRHTTKSRWGRCRSYHSPS